MAFGVEDEMGGSDVILNSGRHTGLWLVLLFAWALVLFMFSVTFLPDIYFYSYYAVDYTFGFIRRGLAGELVRLFPEDRYFTVLASLRWFSTFIFAMTLAIVMRTVAVGSGRSYRRFVLAILVPLLPCGFTYGLFSPRPDLFGATALLGFMVAVKTARSDRALIIASIVFGGVTAILTLMHEAIPFLFGLGVLVALSVLAHKHTEKTLRWSAALAMAPGLLMAVAIAFLGKRGLSKQICERVPHGPVNHPLAGNPDLSMMELLSGYRFNIDYHDWFCRCIAPFFDHSTIDAAKFVAGIDLTARLGSIALGLTLFALTLLAVRHVSGVPLSHMLMLMRKRMIWSLAGLVLFIPIFALGADWTRWCMMIALDIVFVYVLFASGEKESAAPFRFTPRTALIFAAIVLTGPFGTVPGFGFPIELII